MLKGFEECDGYADVCGLQSRDSVLTVGGVTYPGLSELVAGVEISRNPRALGSVAKRGERFDRVLVGRDAFVSFDWDTLEQAVSLSKGLTCFFVNPETLESDEEITKFQTKLEERFPFHEVWRADCQEGTVVMTDARVSDAMR